MSLRAGYYGIKRNLINKIINIPAIRTIGAGLALQDGNLVVTGDLEDYAPNIIANTKLIKDTVGWSGKNWFKVNVSSKTDHDVAITVNSDGSVKANGLASGDAGLILNTSGMSIPAGDYILSTGTEYQEGVFVRFYATRGGQSVVLADVNGAEREITILDGDVVNAYLAVGNGKTVSNKMFYPMIRSADILDDTYEPYFGSTAFPRSEQAVLGAKNLLENKSTSKTESDYVYTVNADKSITITTPATPATKGFAVNNAIENLEVGKKYILSGSPQGGSWVTGNTTYMLYIFDNNGTRVASDYGEGAEFIPQSGKTYTAQINIGENAQGSTSYTFYPMLRLASDPDDTYVPYAMTNRELTDSAADQKTAINAIITAATEAADFAAFKAALGAITPVTRSLSLTKEDITEEVKESEKTVTKKRTTKKTEEE